MLRVLLNVTLLLALITARIIAVPSEVVEGREALERKVCL